MSSYCFFKEKAKEAITNFVLGHNVMYQQALENPCAVLAYL